MSAVQWPPPPPSVDPSYIAEQRSAGWPDIHPEDYCHRCGRPNPLWYTLEWERLGNEQAGICCPSCFAELAYPGETVLFELVRRDPKPRPPSRPTNEDAS